MRSGSEETEEEGTLRFRWAESAGAGLGGTVDVRPVGVEQSNSSIVFGEALILKAFRRVEPGVNPELELLRFLSERGFPNIAVAGRLVRVRGPVHRRHARHPAGVPGGRARRLGAGARGDRRATRRGCSTGCATLGQVTGELHTTLGSDSSRPEFAPDQPSQEALALLVADVDEQIERIFLDLPETEAVAPIAGRGQDVREKLQALSHLRSGGRVIRTHGDYHLGQTMLSDRGWVILDFEGEPARPLPERRLKRSPLRDVAGMLRSFSYVDAGARILRGVSAPEDWEDRARSAFLDGYFERVDPSLLPPGEAPTRQLLAVFELEKAVYELRYELNNRPDWVAIPVAGILRLLDG